MEITRGRWSQYQILNANEKTKPYVVHTELFNEQSFYQNLNQQLVIRPCFGSKEIHVFLIPGEKEKYKIQNESFSMIFNNKSDVYNYLENICTTEKYYILQDFSFLNNRNEEAVELFVTMHRDQFFNWSVTAVLEKNGFLKQKEIDFIIQKLDDSAIQTVLCLEKHYPECPTIVLDIGILKEEWYIRDIFLHFSKSKWSQYQVLSFVDELAAYLPHTQLATTHTILHFIQEHKQVMLKPCLGQWGIGIVQVSWLQGDVFEVHNERKKRLIEGRASLIDYLQTHYLSQKSYLVQERIPLATIEDCIFDARVMVQRENRGSNWEVTAKVAKISSKKYIVTNVATSIILLEEALQKSKINSDPQKLLSKLNEICMIGALYLGNCYLDITRIGMDIGIDKKGDIWIFETNLVPDVSLFKRLQDQSIYEKIIKKNKE
ncbi:YheC/YheD family protein [Solibacillus sp. FSL H8-0538]|uniref:YheC/YheD family protein n=1 Tax=Solibacillus sp. FSL H8-0538 TaxID=2921400 RepID=UPI0030F666A3